MNGEKGLKKEKNSSHDEDTADLISSKIGISEEKHKIEGLVDAHGISLVALKMILLTTLLIMLDGYHITLFGSMIIPLTKYYRLSGVTLEVIPGLIFLSAIISSLLLGYLTRKCGRVLLINTLLIVSFLSHLLMIFIKSIPIFMISRIVIGFSIGIITPTSLNILSEYLPSNSRGWIMCSVWSGFGLGQFILLFSMNLLMPGLEADAVQNTLLMSSLAHLLVLIFSLAFLQDGPRTLILNDRQLEGFDIYSKIICRPLTTKEKEEIRKEVEEGSNKLYPSTFSAIFDKKFLMTTILLTIKRTIHGIFYFGLVQISSLTLKKLGHIEKDNPKHIIQKEILLSVSVFFSTFFAGCQTEINFMGRKLTMLIYYIITLIFVILSVIFTSMFTTMLCLTVFFSSVAAITSHTYSAEVYPTRLRDNGMGFLFAARKFGGFLSLLIMVNLNEVNMWLPYYLTIVLAFICAAIVVFLPYETKGKALDESYLEETLKAG